MNELIWILVAVSSGLVYTLSGHFKGFYQAWRNNEEHSFDFKKMYKNAIIGTVIGVIVVIIQPISSGVLGEEFSIPVIETFAQFAASVLSTMGPVVLVDKWLLASKK